jgi:hypothetical protein
MKHQFFQQPQLFSWRQVCSIPLCSSVSFGRQPFSWRRA